MTAAGALRGAFALQIALALGLVIADLSRTPAGGGAPGLWPGFLPADRAPALQTPVAPGDQRRRFTPGDRLALPDLGDMPSRLRFAQEADTVQLVGEIAPGDAARFADWLDARPSPPRRLTLHSPGGSVSDALAIGRTVRAGGLATTVEEGRFCLSACPYILAAGQPRAVGEDAAVGVHQHYFEQNTILPAFLAVEEIQRGQSEVMAYLVEMGIDPRLMVPALATPPEEIYILLPEELERYGLVTDAE